MMLLFVILYYLIKKCIRSLWIENLVAIHDSNKVLRIREVDDVVGIAREA